MGWPLLAGHMSGQCQSDVCIYNNMVNTGRSRDTERILFRSILKGGKYYRLKILSFA